MNIKLNNVRLSFPALFEREKFEGKEGKFAATFLSDKEKKENYQAVIAECERVQKEAKIKVPRDKWCIRDGDESEYDGYQGCWSIKASTDKRPTIVNRDRTPISKDDEILYAGCYVNAIISLWVQNNQFGKRINANLLAVQFVADGEEFSGIKPVDPDEVFENLALDTSDL